MADRPSSPPPSTLSPRTTGPSASSLRRRGLPGRAATFIDGPSSDWAQRRNSTLSDSLSEARNSIRSSTDDLFLPRVAQKDQAHVATEESHWHSAPLGLALLPAIAGVFFQDGSSFVTDMTLLVLAAIFLNWSVRLPWDWYRSAQAIQRKDGKFDPAVEGIIDNEMDQNEEAVDAQGDSQRDSQQPQKHPRVSVEAQAIRELQIHELVALASCFIFPVVGTWLLHAIRSSLSRPSEGLVSNYNLTIFLLASEVRPFAHLLKLVQARTLHLQHIVASIHSEDLNPEKLQDLTKRLEELEAHVAEAAAARLAASSAPKADQPPSPEANDVPSIIAQAVDESRKALNPDIEALNRAVRRYEKRTALATLQADTRFQRLEAQTRDAIALAAAVQRSSASRRQSYAFILFDWVCACIVVPAQLALSILNLPGRIASSCLLAAQRLLGRRHPTPLRSKSSKGKARSGIGSKLSPQSAPMSKAPALPSLTQQQHQSFESAWGASH
ncbi:hypothetical protein N7462_003327 [Penicillium macrosclerotiorum]|uniref:uncharacterized protein n=1 Tax=Penicillium macrosclerotiorum TaxID=303699 RepID=UPI00254699B3|nr:uncharacterized protein N7462_003327 [Penicillium macrosclerotiorum]KAJ5688935.1 hypothetical protein N7462_003327 [Penicillium macrosclerotiorum]